MNGWPWARMLWITLYFILFIQPLTTLSNNPNPQSKIRIHKPDQIDPGYILTLYQKVFPALLNRQGELVHVWDNIRAFDRLQLLPNGHLLALSRGDHGPDPASHIIHCKRCLIEVDWHGNPVWRYEQSHQMHHDFERKPNGNTLVLFSTSIPSEYKQKIQDETRRNVDIKSVTIQEINPDKKVIWQWNAYEHLDLNRYSGADHPEDWLHINSVQTLPNNQWYEQGDQQFRPGNILVSVRNLNAVMIIDKKTQEIVWEYTGDFQGGLAHQHEARMVPPNYPGAGHILIFDNGIGIRNVEHAGRSYILEINPVTKDIEWRYGPTKRDFVFFSPFAGAQQRLKNGNTLISASTQKRIFEVNRDGEIVWELALNYFPLRPVFYPLNWCDQFSSLQNLK